MISSSRDLNFFLNLIYKATNLSHLAQTHAQIVLNGLHNDLATVTKLTHKISDLDAIHQASLLCSTFPKPDLFLYNVLIIGFSQNNLPHRALDLYIVKNYFFEESLRGFKDMVVGGNPIRFNNIDCSASGPCRAARFESGDDGAVFGSEGTIGCPDLVSYNAMISGFSCNNETESSVKLFKKLLCLWERVYSSTIVGLIPVFPPHSGLVNEGEEVFHSMVHDHGFEPLAEHYDCMVDLLGRDGILEKALEFIFRMPVAPGPAVWGALLGACMIHKDTNRARLASDNLFELDLENVAYYVLLANIY
ncbi:pentatricopeptide repeat (PPR) superfamily protein [Actinidia rufa]|uniref:Pentatricopeptide repeat (PPR) superfamily protein n=1 Tax=Actinidia rufa TaxID=165716 RepID=A0A7J0DGK2_9ERIC|nr:pentatricopeptide repeat (PPR) superfamily protein [Actinidia rufa]